MNWKIENLSINHSLPDITTYNVNIYEPKSPKIRADITIVFDSINLSFKNIEEFENKMKSSEFIVENEKFTRKEIIKALQEMYPERFI